MAPPRLRSLLPVVPVLDTRVAKVPPKQADPHYASPEHVAWRKRVLARAGGRCEATGCKAPHQGRLIADHIVELRDGGAPFDLSNGQALCLPCHNVKTLAERARRMARPT